MTAPFLPAETDLRDFPFMPVDIVRLFGSEFHTKASDAEWRAGVTLWLKSFHQVPAASLPNDDASLAMLAELGRDVKSWRKVRAGALRGWVLCDDGRFYHKVVAEKALEAWLEKLAQRKASAMGNAKRWKLAFDPSGYDQSITTGRAMLAAINPQSRSLRKRMPVMSHDDPDGSPDGIPEDIPDHSQETGTETGIDLLEERETARGRATLELVKSDVYRWEPTDEDRAEAAAAGFTEGEAAELIATHRDYLASHDKIPTAPAATWRNFLRTRKPKRPVGGTSAEAKTVFLELGTPQHDAWTKHRGTTLPVARHERKEGWWLPSEWPPGHTSDAERAA